MVTTARLTAGLSGLRNRNTRVTNKTQLRVIRGNIEADPIILDEDDDEKNRILASQGVDEEDANEHHLQAALFASSQRALSSAQTKQESAVADPDVVIPTPDAAGLVAAYDDLYPANRFTDPATHLRFSDSIDESFVGGLAGSFTYFLDQRDAEWLAKNNGAAKGEGTSANGNGISINGINNPSGFRGMPRTPHARSAKAKGKDPENLVTSGTPPNVVIDPDNFELIMGLYEKWTDEVVSPYLHLSSDPEHFPDFSNYLDFFTGPIAPSTFASFEVPPNIPASEQMVQLAKAIYPWWKERRIERSGQRIVPQLRVLILEAQEKEDKTGGSPYTCFRKRDVKPMRKTRTNNVTHIEKLARLRGELQSSLELAQLVLQREKLKRDSLNAAVEVWRMREALAEYMKQLNSAAPGSVPPADELLLFDRERKPRKPKSEGTGTGRIILSTNRRLSHLRGVFPDSLDPHSPLTLIGDTSHAFEECQKWPSARTAGIQREVERELLKARKDDAYWEDLVDVPYQPAASSAPEKLFKPFALNGITPSSPSISPITSSMYDEDPTSRSPRVARSLRIRTGRGGRLHLDRRLHLPKPHRILQREWAGYPPRAADFTAPQQDAERWAARNWRPRDTHLRFGRRERKLGEEYWSYHSICQDGRSSDLRQQDVGGIEPLETQDLTFGFEQSVSGWDARETWARARATREEGGWKPTPHLAVNPEVGLEIATRNAVERERIVEAWRGNTSELSNGGGALALFTDGGGILERDEPAVGRHEQHVDDMIDPWSRNEPTPDVVEQAGRLEERWRYDSESQEADDRFLLDDYQSKFLRTTITLLDVKDHEMVKTDPQFLTPLPPKQNRYLDYQLRQHSGLVPSSPSVTQTLSTPHTIPFRQIPLLSSAVSSVSPVPNGTAVSSRSSDESASPQHSLSNPNLKTTPVSATSNGISAYPIPTSSPKPNGAMIPMIPGGARLPPDSGSALRMNTPGRTKHANGVSLSQAGLSSALSNGVANGRCDTSVNGTFAPPLSKGYSSLKTTLDRVITAQQDPQSRPYKLSVPPLNGINGGEHNTMSMSLGVGNLQLKLPAQRTMSIRTNGAGENHGDAGPAGNSSPNPAAESYVLAHAQHLSLPRLSSTGTRAA